MDCGACEPWVQAIQKDYAYLLAEHGFALVHCQAARQGEHCLIALESPLARIKFEIEQGVPTTYFGTLDSPLDWQQQVDGVTVWYVDNVLLNFIEQRDGAARPAPPPASAEPRSTEALLAADAARLRPHAAELIAAFAPNRPAEWWRAFDAYQAARLAQIRQRARAS